VGTIIMRDLIIINGVPPNPEWKQYAQSVLEFTLLRSSGTRARGSHHLTSTSPGRGEVARKRLAYRVLSMANGDWSKPTLVHYCRMGCCTGPEDTIRKYCETTLALIMAVVPPVVALNRWSTVAMSLSWWAAGISLHAIIPQAFRLMLTGLPRDVANAAMADEQQGPDDMAAACEPHEDFHQAIGRRLGKGYRFLRDAQANFRVLLCSAIFLPVDAFVQFVSSTDAAASANRASGPTKPMAKLMVERGSGLAADLLADVLAHLRAGSSVHEL